ncbi:MAG: hypothetical protein K8F28_05910 [Ignavibacteriaceae bacterium]|nr:hypothetical protein [Ignavibacteriaceae bacterium]
MLKRYIFIVLFLFTGCSSEEYDEQKEQKEQKEHEKYLTYEDLTDLLNIFPDSVKIDEFMKKRGFSLSSWDGNEYDTDITYTKVIGKENYDISIGEYKAINYLFVSERSINIERLKYYEKIVKANGYKLKKSGTVQEINSIDTYQNTQYELSLIEIKYSPKIYEIALSRITKIIELF